MHTRPFTTIVATVVTAAASLSLAACGATATPAAHAATAPAAPPRATLGARQVSDPSHLPALTGQQLQQAELITDDVKALGMGITTDQTPLVADGTAKASVTDCQPLLDVWQSGGSTYKESAYEDLSVLEANPPTTPAGKQLNAVHALHLAALTGSAATKAMETLTRAYSRCQNFTQADPSGTIHQAITRLTNPNLGDQALTWGTTMTLGSQSRYGVVTVVRVGSTLISGFELTDATGAVKSIADLPPTNTALLNAQVTKLRTAR